MNYKASFFIFLIFVLAAGCVPAPTAPTSKPAAQTAPVMATQTPTSAPSIEPTPTFFPEADLSLPSPTPLPREPRNAPSTWDGAWTNLDPANFTAQTFVAVSNSIRAVEVNVLSGKGDSDTLTLSILDASRNVLAETTASVGKDGFDGWLRFEFSQPVSVTPGKVYLLRLRGTKVWVGWKLSESFYPRGTAILLGKPALYQDFIFKVNPAVGEDSNPLTEVAYEPLPTIPPQPGTLDEMVSRCPTAEEVAAIDKDIKLIFEGANDGELVCKASEGSADLTALQKGAYQALLAMKMLTFTRPLPWTDLPLYDWFVSTAKGIRFRDDIPLGFCCSPARVINIPSGMYSRLSPREIWRWADPRSAWGIAGGHVQLFVHEARHIESGPHTCGNKDTSLAEMNAFGVTYYLQLWIAHYLTDPAILTAQEPYPDYYRELADGMAEHIRTQSFCQVPPPFVP